MTKTADRAADAFFGRETKNISSNTRVLDTSEGTWLELFGKRIAHYDNDGHILISDGGYHELSITTKDRLNALAWRDELPDFKGVFSDRGVYFLNLGGIPLRWDGGWTIVSDGLTIELLLEDLNYWLGQRLDHPRSRKIPATIRERVAQVRQLVSEDPRYYDVDLEESFEDTAVAAERMRPGMKDAWRLAYDELVRLQ